MRKRKVSLFQFGEDGFFRAIAADQPEGPVGDGFAIVLPGIGPCVERGSGESRFTAEAERGGEKFGLLLF